MTSFHQSIRLPSAMPVKTIILILMAGVALLALQWHHAHGTTHRPRSSVQAGAPLSISQPNP